MLTRRTTIAGGLAAALLPGLTAAQEEAPSVDLLERFIIDVVQDGDVSVLPELVAADGSIPDYDITGIDAFTAASEAGHTSRQEQFEEYEFVIEAIAGTEEWALAFVRLQGVDRNGQAVDDSAFYAVKVADGLITELYLGVG
jgi:hypothetical protein